jgi:hypothetical protein
VNTTLIVETAFAVVAIDPATRAYLAISKDRAARAKARREAAPPKFTTLAELFPYASETTAAPAAGNAPAGAAGSGGANGHGRPPYVPAAPADILAARALDALGASCSPAWRQVAEARIADPAASWPEIAGRLGTTEAQARGRFRRMVGAAGLAS